MRRWSTELRGWFGPIVLSTADQGLSAGSNFAITMLSARWLDGAQYGAYAVGISINLFLLSLYTETVVEPMTVLVCSRYLAAQRPYYAAVARLHGLASAGLVALLALAWPLASHGNAATSAAFMGVAVSLPFNFSYFLLRRICYSRADPRTATIGSFFYAASALGALAAIGPSRLSTLLVFIAIGAGGLGGSIVLGSRLWAQLKGADSHASQSLTVLAILPHHMTYARWTLPGSVAQALGALVVPPALALAAGLPAAAELRAAQNFVLPLLQLQSAVSLLMVPSMARRFVEDGARGLRRALRRASASLLALSAPYALLIALGSSWLLGLAYGPNAYPAAGSLLSCVLPAALLGVISGPSASALRAAHEPAGLLWMKLAAALVTCALGLPLIAAFGVLGAGWSMLAIACAEAVVSAWVLHRALERRSPGVVKAGADSP